jgi:hypothetical protein
MTAKKAAKPAKKAAAKGDELWGPMHVGVYMQVRYSTARDMILSGKFGAPQKDGRHLLVPAARVKAYRDERDAKRAAKTA